MKVLLVPDVITLLEFLADSHLQKVEREPGYGGRWEGYGSLKTEKTGSECAETIRLAIDVLRKELDA